MERLKKNFYLLALIFVNAIHSQDVQITYVNPTSIEVCGDEVTYEVTIANNSVSVLDTNSLIEVKLPEGIVYVDNSVSSGFSVDTSSYNNPVFSFNSIVDTNSEIVLQFNGITQCSVYNLIDTNSDSVSNKIKYSYTIGGENQPNVYINNSTDFDMSVTDTYNLNFRDVDVNIPLEVLGQPNQTLKFTNTYEIQQQQVDITIPGNSLDFSEFLLIVTADSELEFNGVSAILIDGTPYNSLGITVSDTNPIELTFNASDIGIPNFNALMKISVIFEYKASSCFKGNSQHVTYKSGIRCTNGDLCVRGELSGDFEYEQLESNLSIDFTIIDDQLNLCGDKASVSLTLRNEDNAEGPAYNIYLYLLENAGASISNIVIDGVSVNDSDYISPYGPGVLLQQVEFPSSQDLDGNGMVDLAPGDSLTVTCDVQMSLPPYSSEVNPGFEDINNCDSKYSLRYFYSNFYYNVSECDTIYDLIGMNAHHSLQWKDIPNNPPVFNLDTDLDDGELTRVQFCIDRAGGGTNNLLYDDGLMLETQIEIPCGAQLDESSITFTDIDGNLLAIGTPQISIVNGKTIVNVALTEPYENISGDYGGCFEFDIEFDCDNLASCTSLDPMLSATAFGYFSECPDERMNLGCTEKELYLHCMPLIPSCPSPYALQATNFDATRMSYGSTPDGTQITIDGVDDGTFTGLNTQGAYACDTIRAEITGITACDLGVDDVKHGYIWYSHPEDFPFLTMVGAEYDINGGTLNTVSSFSLRTDLSTSTKKVFEVQITDTAMNVGDILRIRGVYTVDKTINNTTLDSPNTIPDFPNVYNLAEFRGGLSLGSMPPPSPFHYGAEFEVYGLNYFSEFTGTAPDCSVNGNFEIGFHIRGGSEDDFPNEFRNVIQLVGPVDVYIPAAAIGGIDFLNAEYTASGLPGAIPLTVQHQGGGVYRILDDFGTPLEYRSFDKVATEMYCSIRMDFVLNDCSLAPNQTIDVVGGSYLEQAYAEEPCREEIAFDLPTKIVSNGNGFSVGDLNLDVVNPVFKSINNITRYQVNVNNTSNKDALFPWIKFTYPNGLIDVANAPAPDGYEINGSPLVYVGATITTLLMRLSAINAGTTMEGHVDVTLVDCEIEDSIVDVQIETGVSCQPIADNILEDTNLLCSLDTNKKVELEIVKSNLWMDVIPLFDVNTPVNSYDELQYLVQIFNNEKANISNPFFQIDIPTGIDMSVQYRYPVTEIVETMETFSNISFSNPVSITTGVPWELQGINGILPGYTANTCTVFNNHYQLLVTITPTCDYNGVDKIYFTTNGHSNCNEEIYVPIFETTPNITGLEAISDYSPEISMDVSQNGECGNFIATVNYSSDTTISEDAELIFSLPTGLSTLDSLVFDLPVTGNASFTFEFTTDIDYYSITTFNYTISINTVLEFSEEECVSNLIVNDSVITNVEANCGTCVIANIDISAIPATIYDDSCLEYILTASNPVVTSGAISSYNWNVTDIEGNFIGSYFGNNTVITLPSSGAPFTIDLTIIGIHDNGNECLYEDTTLVTPNCVDCNIEKGFKVKSFVDKRCSIREFIPTFYVGNGIVQNYQWSIYDSNLVLIDTIEGSDLSNPVNLMYEFPNNGEYKICLEITGVNEIGEPCTKRICEEIFIECKPCGIEAKFEIEVINKCTFKFINLSDVNGLDNVQYLWDFGDGNTSTVFEPLHSYTIDGVYEVTLTAVAENEIGDRCTSTYNSKKFKVKKCRPRKEGGNTRSNDGIIIYPNPNKGVFKLVIGESRKPNKVEIFNTIGQLVFVNDLIKDDEISIDISNEASGIYLVKLTGEKYQKMKKIIIN